MAEAGPVPETQAETESGFETGVGERLIVEADAGSGVMFEPGTEAECKIDLRRHAWMSETSSLTEIIHFLVVRHFTLG